MQNGRHDLRRVRPPAPGHRPGRDAGVARQPRRRRRRRTARPAPATSCRKLLERARELAGQLPGHGLARPTSTPSRPSRSRGSPATSTSSAASARFVRWNAAVMVIRANKHADGIGGHLSTFASLGQPLRGRLQPLLPRQGRRPAPATTSTSRATPRPASTPAPSSRAGSPRTTSTTSAGRSAAPACRSLPAPAADAGLLGVPHGVDGPRPDHRASTRPGSTATSRTGASTTPARAGCGASSATASATSPRPSARSRWPAASSSTT